MKHETASDATAADAQISALIATLLDAGEKLQVLTHGEVDAVAGPEGRAYLLHDAQVFLREREVAKNVAILNSLPANIALLDSDGVIVSVNEAWRSFALANVMHAPAVGLGQNYLDICDRAVGAGSAESAIAARAIRSVLSGAESSVRLEYACHSPTEERWFQMTISAVGESMLRGAVVMHLDITERTMAETTLRVRETEQRESARLLSIERSRLLEAQRAAKIGSWETDLATMQVIWSEETYRIHELEPTLAPLSHDQFLELVHPADRERVDSEFQASLTSGEPTVIRHRLLLPSGRIKFVVEHWQSFDDEAGQPSRVVGTCQDVTEGRLAEVRIERLSRGYRVLSQINSLIVRVRDRDELFREACRIAVESGGFPLAWIGKVDRANARIVPVASAGATENFLQHVGERFSLADDAPLGHGPSALAVRTRTPVIVNDVTVDPRIRDPALLAELGILSLVSLPILVAGEVVALFGLHASDVDYFDEAEIELLSELASDIGFAVDYIGNSEKINYLAFFDSLTGLANRNLFMERVAQCLPTAACHNSVMVLVDLEHFKSINDSLGVHGGDDLLKKVATWLSEHLEDSTLLARVGADQFALMLTESDRPGDVARKLERLIKEFHDQTFLLDGSPYRLAAKFGVATFPDDANNAHGLFQKTESALKNAKAGGHRHLFYTQKMTDSIARKMGLENQLRHALDNDEFVLHYQPKVDLRSDKVVGAEALIRWNDSRTQSLIPPVQFVPILEESGLIIEVGRWAIRRAIEHFIRCLRDGLPAVRIAVNVSAVQLRDPAFVDDVRQLLSVDDLAHAGLELEITESMIMTDIEQSILTLRALREMGVRIAIDDFGTGFSSLGYLSKLPVDSLKIDRSFVNDMTRSPEGLSLVSTIITLAHSLHLQVVAEGVETEEQRGLLKLLRCDEMQGYLFSKPVPWDQFESRWLLTGGRGSSATL